MPKTLLITESDIRKMVCEVLDELNLLPADGSQGTPNYLQFIKYLETIGHYGELPATSSDNIYSPETCIEATNQGLLDIDEGIDAFKLSYALEDFVAYAERPAEELIKPNWLDDENEICIDESDDVGNIDTWQQEVLTPDGQRLWKGFSIEYGKRSISDLFTYNLGVNKKGQVYVERMITIPSLNGNYIDKISGEDYYKTLMRNYGDGVGCYWSYCKNAADAYWGGSWGGSYDLVILKGWVNPGDLDLPRMIFNMNADEYEVNTNPGAQVQIDEIEIYRGPYEEKKIPLKSPIVVPA